MGGTNIRKDFFISYTSKDRKWAEWIAWQLEQRGYTTIIQAWHFPPGSNFVHAMDEALKQAIRVIGVLSPDYLQSQYAKTEWMEAFRRDPLGKSGYFLPIRVELCDVNGLLGPIVYIDLVGTDERTARERLLVGVSREHKLPTHVPFPNTSSDLSKHSAPPSTLLGTQKGLKKKGKERIQLDFSAGSLERLDQLKERIGAGTRAETIRQALRLFEWFISETGPNDVITVSNSDGEIFARFKAKLLHNATKPE